MWCGSWDPRWPRDVLAKQYKHNAAGASCDADITLLRLHLDSFVSFMRDAGYEYTYIIFVDDLLLAQNHILQSVVYTFESTLLGGSSVESQLCMLSSFVLPFLIVGCCTNLRIILCTA